MRWCLPFSRARWLRICWDEQHLLPYSPVSLPLLSGSDLGRHSLAPRLSFFIPSRHLHRMWNDFVTLPLPFHFRDRYVYSWSFFSIGLWTRLELDLCKVGTWWGTVNKVLMDLFNELINWSVSFIYVWSYVGWFGFSGLWRRAIKRGGKD